MADTGRKVLTRVFTALIVLPVVVWLVWAPQLWFVFALFISALAGIGLYEYYAIVRAREISPETIGGIVAGILVALSGCAGQAMITNLLLYGACLLVSALHIVRGQHSVAGLSSSVFGVFYVGWFGAHFLLLHRVPDIGPGLVTLLLVTVALTDTGAYAIGSLFGKHKIAPKVSPGKTWEGSIGGFAAGLAGVAIVYAVCDRFGWRIIPGWTLEKYLGAGALLALASQIGDLAESCLKRDAGVKDSGNLFPGHGGVLDRCDSFLFAAPLLYYMAHSALIR